MTLISTACARRLAERLRCRDRACAHVNASNTLDDLVAEEMRPRTPFEDGDERWSRPMAAIDAMDDRRGRWAVMPAKQGFMPDCRMRAEDQSPPRWTTRIGEVPVVTA